MSDPDLSEAVRAAVVRLLSRLSPGSWRVLGPLTAADETALSYLCGVGWARAARRGPGEYQAWLTPAGERWRDTLRTAPDQARAGRGLLAALRGAHGRGDAGSHRECQRDCLEVIRRARPQAEGPRGARRLEGGGLRPLRRDGPGDPRCSGQGEAPDGGEGPEIAGLRFARLGRRRWRTRMILEIIRDHSILEP
jgi:hypothetical protein